MNPWGVSIKETSLGTSGVSTDGDRLDFAADRLMEESDTMDATFQPIHGDRLDFPVDRFMEESDRIDARFQPIQEHIPLRADTITKKKVELLPEGFIISEEDVQGRAHLGGYKESDLHTVKEVNREGRSDLQDFTTIPNDFEETKQGWFGDHEDRKFEYGGNIGKESVPEGACGAVEGSSDECNYANLNMEIEKPDEDLKTGYNSRYRGSSQATIVIPSKAGQGPDESMLIEGIQQSCPLAVSTSSIEPSTSMNLFLTSFPATTTNLPTGSWSIHLDPNGCQNLAKVATDDYVEDRYGHADNFLRETSSEDVRSVDNLFTGGETLPNNLGISLHQPCHVEGSQLETYNEYANLLDPSAGNIYTSHGQGLGGIESSELEHKITVAEFSLRRVLSDSITGVLMDDAMVAQCGHSFGISSLQRVLETNLCLSCGAPVPPGSLIPNFALRAAVQAYKREEQLWMSPFKGLKRRREQAEQPESSDGKKTSWGNKRTPERFVGREAVITTQCLNGWYLVRTLDNGESVRLQYRSLQKLGESACEDTETPTVLVSDKHPGQSADMSLGIEASKGQSFASAPTSLSEDMKEGCTPSDLKDAMVTFSIPTAASKGLRSEFLNRSIRRFRRGVSTTKPTDMTGSSWLSGGTSSNSSQELLSGQSEEKLLPQDAIREQSIHAKKVGVEGANAHEGLELTEKHCVQLEKVEIGLENSSLENAGHQHKQCGKGTKGGGGVETGGDWGTNSGGEVFTVRSKRSALHSRGSHLTAGMDLPEADPYKKVYVSGSRRRGVMGHISSTALESKAFLIGISSTKDHQQENDMNTDGKYVTSKSIDSLFDNMKLGILNLESEIPWTCLRKFWKRSRLAWLKALQESSTIKDLCTKLQEFHDALLLTAPGGMSDEEWEKQLSNALESGRIDILSSLWERIQEDVSKWMESKPKRNTELISIKDESGELAEVHKLFPQLNVGGLSPAGITAATTVAAAEAFADGQLDTEALLAIPMKLIRKHNHQDLAAVREAIEREKRHIAAKLIHIEAAFTEKNNLSSQPVESNTLVKNPELLSASPVLLAIEPSSAAMITVNADVTKKGKLVMVPAIREDQAVGLPEEDGEATDMSDSD